jgi:hypothetical protein
MNKERVCFLYECRFRNDGSPLFLKTVMENSWDELGLLEPVKHFVPGDEERGGRFDLYIWPDFGEDGLPLKYPPCPKPNIYWVSDSHMDAGYRLRKAEEFDMVCVTISEHVDVFKKHLGHEKVFWVPHAGEEMCYRNQKKIKKYDVCFIGYIPGDKRIDHLDRLFREIPNFWYGQKFFEPASDIYNMSKIVFNNSVAGEANMRSFEAALSGSMLLTDYSLDLIKLGYEDNKHLVFYSGMDEMIDKAKFYLENDLEREKIAGAGYEFTLGNHTYFHRAKQIMDLWRMCNA